MEDWHGRALRLGATVAELRSARRHADESRRLTPGRRMRRSLPGPPPIDIPWDRVADQLAAALRSLAETAHENPRFAAPTEQALGALATLLRSAADVCAVDTDRSVGGCGDKDLADRALDAARTAGARLASLLTDPEHGTTASLGELTAATTRLLDDLERAKDHSGQPYASRAS
ncbi:hypothetical protein [Streptomyces sp. KL118A]|uniref:hypothetical protein n=1 Tax=Streptomyces sp. KL118A TaxID=3045153 RepID=UPI00278C5A94|nr:hypothetical protein [Streptomyces sp. KL118A]